MKTGLLIGGAIGGVIAAWTTGGAFDIKVMAGWAAALFACWICGKLGLDELRGEK